MELLRVIAHLMDYPDEELHKHLEDLILVVAKDQHLSNEHRHKLAEFITDLATYDLYDLQARYDGTFERGRYLSLMIFEHVHGESRDRGQAMVDLLDLYKLHGFELDSREMPDYLPVFLEFLSTQDEAFIQEWLGDVSHILALLGERLEKKGLPEQILFDCLLSLTTTEIDTDEIVSRVSQEPDEDSLEAIDAAWEDKEVRFDAPTQDDCSACPSQQTGSVYSTNNSYNSDTSFSAEPQPLKWYDTKEKPHV